MNRKEIIECLTGIGPYTEPLDEYIDQLMGNKTEVALLPGAIRKDYMTWCKLGNLLD